MEPGSACLLESSFVKADLPKTPFLKQMSTVELSTSLFSCEQEELYRSGRGMYRVLETEGWGAALWLKSNHLVLKHVHMSGTLK